MAEVPRIVRERLSDQAAVKEHPDANLLSAFAEHALKEQERTSVLDHLSRCADCRKIVALTLPEVTEERAVAAAAAQAPAVAKPSWWRSPVVHWGALTAAALIVLIAVGERMRLREGRSASAPAIATYSANEVAQKPAAEAPQVPVPTAEPKQPTKMAKTPTTRLPTETLSRAKTAETVSAGRIAALGGAAESVVAKNAPPAPPPPNAALKKAAPPVGVPAVVGPPPEKSKIDQAQAQAVPAPSAGAREAVEARDSLAATAAAPAVKSEAAVLSQRRDAMLAKRASLSPRWSVSDSGALQRSFDGGRSWKDVAVGDGVTFRAVATVGSDVWAGGSGGALYHSADGGEQWSQVRVRANGRALSGDIVRIEFTDAQAGVVATSTGETWTTSDAGATWRSQ